MPWQLLYYRYDSDEAKEDLLETDPNGRGLAEQCKDALDFL